MAKNKKWIDALDKVFSLFVRNTGSQNGFSKCYTCGKWDLIKNLQCGHYVSRRYFATRWEPKNCKPQCVKCNIYSEGKKDTFGIKLMEDYGKDHLFWLEAKKHNEMKMFPFEYQLLIKDFQTKLDKLL